MTQKQAKNSDVRLGEAIMKAGRAINPSASQDELKRRVFSRISNMRREQNLNHSPVWYMLLAQRIHEIGEKTRLSFPAKALAKQHLFRIIDSLQFQKSRRSPWAIFPRLSQSFFNTKAWSFALVLLFVFTWVFGFFNAPDTVKAAPSSYLESYAGEVEVLRNGSPIAPKEKLLLRDKDVILTKQGSAAAIHFLDDSVSRLSENSELRIERLFVNADDSTKTLVELQLKKGRMWAKVLSIVDDFSHFQVKAQNAVVVAKKRAVFDLQVDDKGKTKVAAVQNSLDVTVAMKKQKKVLETTIVNGFTLEVKAESTKVVSQKNPQEVDSTWIAKNVEADRAYVTQITERDKEQRKESAADVNPVKAISNTAAQVFKNDTEKQKAKLKAAEVKLVEAEGLLELGQTDEANQLLGDFQNLMNGVATQFKSQNSDDQNAADDLKALYENQLKLYRKQFSLFLPDDPLYPLKKVVTDAELILASTPVEKTERALDIASEKLLEATELTENGNQQLAGQALQEFTSAVQQVNQDAKSLSQDDKVKVATAVLDKKSDQMKMLEALTQEVELKAPPVLGPAEQRGIALSEILGKANKASLSNVAEAVSNSTLANEKPSEEVLQKVHELEQVQVNGKSVVEVSVTAKEVKVENSNTLGQVISEVSAPKEISAPKIDESKATEGDEAGATNVNENGDAIDVGSAGSANASGSSGTSGGSKNANEANAKSLKSFLKEIPGDSLSGVTVITIEAKPSVKK